MLKKTFQIETMKSEKKSNDVKLCTLTKEIDGQKGQNKKLEEEMADLKMQVCGEQTRMENLEYELTKARREVEDNRKAKEQLKNELEPAGRMLECNSQHKDRLQVQLREMQEKIVEIDKLHKKEKAQKKERLRDITEKLSEAKNTAVKKFGRADKDLFDQLVEVRKEAAEKVKNYQQQTEKELHARITELEKELSRVYDTRRALQEENLKTAKVLEMLQEKNSQQQARIWVLKRKKELLGEGIDKRRGRNKKMLESLQWQLANIEAQVRGKQADIEKMVACQEPMMAEIEETKRAIHEAQEAFAVNRVALSPSLPKG